MKNIRLLVGTDVSKEGTTECFAIEQYGIIHVTELRRG